MRGLFYGIGHQPNSHLFADDIDLDEGGYVKVPFPLLPLSIALSIAACDCQVLKERDVWPTFHLSRFWPKTPNF